MPKWFLLESGPGEPAFNMAVDEALLDEAPRLGLPVLRFYGWTEPAASFGYFQHYAEVQQLTPLRPLVRRPTGGGIVPHDADWTYSLAFPAGHQWHALKAVESYQRVHEWIRGAFARLGIATVLAPASLKAAPGQCFVGYEKSDVLRQGRKIAGAAQRRTREGLLIQGSVQPPPGVERSTWQRTMCEVASAGHSAEWLPFELDPRLKERVESLVGRKYSQPAYNRKR